MGSCNCLCFKLKLEKSNSSEPEKVSSNSKSSNSQTSTPLKSQKSSQINCLPQNTEIEKIPQISEVIKKRSTSIENFTRVSLTTKLVLNQKNTLKVIKEPYIIIVGISDYDDNFDSRINMSLRNINESKTTEIIKEKNVKKNKTLKDSVKKDVKQLTRLFKQIYGFKYVATVLNKINDETLDSENFLTFLINQRSNINRLIKSEKDISPDSVLFFYAGHGKAKGIVFTNRELFEYKKIAEIFSNEKLKALITRPKCLFFDCCRGNLKLQRIRVERPSMWSEYSGSRSGSISSITKFSAEISSQMKDSTPITRDNKHIRNYRNKFDDTVFTFSSTHGNVSYDNFEIGYLTRAIVNIYKQKDYFDNKTMHDASLDVKRLVNTYTEGRQTCEIQSTLDYNVKFIPKNKE